MMACNLLARLASRDCLYKLQIVFMNNMISIVTHMPCFTSYNKMYHALYDSCSHMKRDDLKPTLHTIAV